MFPRPASNGMERENKLLLFFTLLVIIGLGAAFYFIKARPLRINPVVQSESSSDKTALEKFQEVPILTDDILAKNDTVEHLSYEVHFPRVHLASDTTLAKEANAVISAFVNDQIDGFKRNVADGSTTDKSKDASSEFSMRWSPEMLSPTILSLRFDYSEYIEGAAHPNTESRILNYDLKRHLLLPTGTLFASSTQALPFLSSYSRNALQTILAGISKEEFASQVIPGTGPISDNFEAVALTKTGLLIIFNPYQVAPYSRGAVQVEIPLADVAELISPDVRDAMRMASTNIIEATEETATPTKMEL